MMGDCDRLLVCRPGQIAQVKMRPRKISSAQKARSVHANINIDSASGGATLQVIRSDKGLQVMDSALTDSEWFTRFTTGLCLSIGERRN